MSLYPFIIFTICNPKLKQKITSKGKVNLSDPKSEHYVDLHWNVSLPTSSFTLTTTNVTLPVYCLSWQPQMKKKINFYLQQASVCKVNLCDQKSGNKVNFYWMDGRPITKLILIFSFFLATNLYKSIFIKNH